MQSVTCRLGSADLATKMAEMRRWLDHHQSHTENFEFYKILDSIIIVQIDFTNASDASEFAAQFDGETVL